MTRQTYLVPEKGVPLKHIKNILKGNGCPDCRDRSKCFHCVLQGTREDNSSNMLHLNVDQFLERLVKHKVITKGEALGLMLDKAD